MLDAKEAMKALAIKQANDPKPKRYVELYQSMLDRKVSQISMDRICYAIGSIHRETGIVRTNRPLPIDPGKLDRDASIEAKKMWKEQADSFIYARDQNVNDRNWIEGIEANMADSCELSDEEQGWVDYILHGAADQSLPGVPF
jgi:hypothetical protein